MCQICKGAGYLRLDVPVGHPNFGRIIPCECKIREREAKLLRQYLELSGLEQLEDWTFDTFDPTVPGVADAYRIALEYARNPDGWLLLMGGYGCGKTHLAAAIANYVLRHQRLFPLFTVVPDLLDYLRATFAPDRAESYDERFEQVRNAGLLVLDDLGTEHTTPWATEKLFQIINYRYNQRKPTVITTNRDLDDLDERIRSRLCDRAICRAVFIRAGDYRLRRSRVSS
ncbi:MAG: ATP-binding protein [Thermomicrobium sp.]|nr:ATP-binding protein [Thermomicrobium sp.]MDW8059248.1 ATP-binding protein [Thermomicrobium sp.]